MYRAGVVPLLAFAVLMLNPPLGNRPAPAPAKTSAAPAAPVIVAPSVRIEHELVRLPQPQAQPPAQPKPTPRVSRPWRSTRMAHATQPESRPRLLVRASRAFVGDGRFRPEPFPRLTR